MGVPWDECENVGRLIGIKTMVNEFVAFQRMQEMIKANLLSVSWNFFLIAPRRLHKSTLPYIPFFPDTRSTLSLSLSSFAAGEDEGDSDLRHMRFLKSWFNRHPTFCAGGAGAQQDWGSDQAGVQGVLRRCYSVFHDSVHSRSSNAWRQRMTDDIKFVTREWTVARYLKGVFEYKMVFLRVNSVSNRSCLWLISCLCWNSLKQQCVK